MDFERFWKSVRVHTINIPLLMQYIASKHVTYILFNINIVNVPCLCSNILVAHALYGLHISLLIRHSRACTSYQNFLDGGLLQKCTYKEPTGSRVPSGEVITSWLGYPRRIDHIFAELELNNNHPLTHRYGMSIS